MSLTEEILQLIQEKKLHFSLIDPDKQKPREAGFIARIAEESGSSAIMVGGSTLVSREQVDETVLAIKDETSLPVILFPSGARYLSKYADAIFFMSLLNSRDVDYVIREHVKGAFFVRDSGIEPIPMGYLIVEPGMTVGRVGKVDPVRRDDIETAVGFALAAKYLGMRFFYLEAGSGAPQPVPNEMISAVKENVDLPLLVGGGIRDPNIAKEKAEAGADIIITGTALEKNKRNLKSHLRSIIEAIEEVK
ncbi:MAG TPA: geranylgeranylglyceryl/heptaprenylglyceryl phosphate synthase [Thermoplasmatales archaeon]|nr:geranylgeranylglyceryl/heptaprenylglyceryl phosphate synthase [Thermoplasmatales archaeon]